MLVISDIKAEISIRISLQLQVIFSSVSYIFLDDLKYYAYNFKFKQWSLDIEEFSNVSYVSWVRQKCQKLKS